MREILFRVWDGALLGYVNPEIFNLGELNDFDTVLFEQYTGLKDKNGVKIFEGDIVYIAGYGEYEVEFPFFELYESENEQDIGEILGNIHEN